MELFTGLNCSSSLSYDVISPIVTFIHEKKYESMWFTTVIAVSIQPYHIHVNCIKVFFWKWSHFHRPVFIIEHVIFSSLNGNLSEYGKYFIFLDFKDGFHFENSGICWRYYSFLVDRDVFANTFACIFLRSGYSTGLFLNCFNRFSKWN